VTQTLGIHGRQEGEEELGELWFYGADAAEVLKLMERPELSRRLHASLPMVGAQVIWAVRQEMARSVEDVLARRTRALFLNARAAAEMAREVARLMAQELGRDEEWEKKEVAAFEKLAGGYALAALQK
jgi:glycerol-3-phosphate dehydrogenase